MNSDDSDTDASRAPIELRIVYATTTGTSRKFAEALAEEARGRATASETAAAVAARMGLKTPDAGAGGGLTLSKVDVVDAAKSDPWDLLEADAPLLVVFITSTWTDGVVPETAVRWYDALLDMSNDFRVGSAALSGGKARFAVYGLGSSEYEENWCRSAKEVHGALAALGAECLVPMGEHATGCDQADIAGHFDVWRRLFWRAVDHPGEALDLAPRRGSHGSKGGAGAGASALETAAALWPGSKGEAHAEAEGSCCGGSKSKARAARVKRDLEKAKARFGGAPPASKRWG